jgi:agmatinase
MDNKRTYAGIDKELAKFINAEILLQSIPYDGTSTWGKGADKAFNAFLEASENMELYDIETNSEVYTKGVHILPELKNEKSPEEQYKQVYKLTKKLLETGKYLTFLGGEHSISIGIIQAFNERYDDLTVLQLDAHTDLRERYMGSRYNHACAMHSASINTNLIQVGIRSMDKCELEYLNPHKCIFAHDIQGNNSWIESSIKEMSDNVYLTVDLDVFDPGIMPSTGTPEPGGLDWYTVINYLKKVFKLKNVVGFDIVEFAPIKNNKAPDFLVAKLYYKLLSYKYYNQE